MTDKHTVSSSDSEDSNDGVKSENEKTTAAEPELSLQERIARNKERAMQIRAAKRALPQEPSKLVHGSSKIDCSKQL